jgi:Fe-S-cluster containining protein
MNPPKIHRSLVAMLHTAAAAYQDAHVIHRCATCKNPCCRLETQVLELSWKQVKVLWLRDESRADFDKQLSMGKGPAEIRAGNGLYYAHQKTCPAYDENHRTCRVYNQSIKPVGCSDYPVYGDGDTVVADLRCEAVDIKVLAAGIAQTVGPEFRIAQSANKDFPFLVTLSIRRRTAELKSRK